MSAQTKIWKAKMSASQAQQGTFKKVDQSTRWVFTFNNYSPNTLDLIANLDYTSVVEYCVYGKEVGESGTPHLQGTFKFFKKKRRNGIISFIGDCFLEPCVDLEASIDYCKKDGDFVEFGSLKKSSQGKRSDIESVKEDIYLGHTDLDYFLENHSSFYASNLPFIQKYINTVHYAPDPIKRFPLYIWQSELYQYLKGPVCERSIVFIVDPVGNRGKSYFIDMFIEDYPNTAQSFSPGKLADMAYAYSPSTRVLLIDCPRTKIQFLSYEFLEHMKNGRIFSGKYVSETKTFNRPHVVVFMNDFPDRNALSVDRYKIIEITENLCLVRPGAVRNDTGLIGTARVGVRANPIIATVVDNVEHAPGIDVQQLEEIDN